MANEIRARFNFVSGTLSGSLTNVATSMSAAGLANLGVIDATNHAAITIENEIVWVAAHTGGATTATILRGQEGTSAVAHNAGVAWQHGETAIDDIYICKSSTRPSTPYVGMRAYEQDTVADIQWNGTIWEYTNIVYSATGSAWTPNTAYADITSATLTLPAGVWMVQGKVGFDTSTAGNERYTARIFNNTTATDLDSGFVQALACQMWIPLLAIVTLTSSNVVKLQAKTTTVGGAQGLQGNSKIWAVPMLSSH